MMFRFFFGIIRWVVPETALDFIGIHSLTNARVSSEIERMIDESYSFPVIDPSRWEELSESLGGDLYVLHLIFKAGQTGVYGIDIDGQLCVLAYRQYCPSSRHPQSTSLRDYWFLKHLEHTGLVPRVYAVSAPFIAPEDSIGKVDWQGCENSDPEVRYVLSERIIGRSLLEIVSRNGQVVQQPLDVAVRYTIEMIEFIEKIHREKIVHGDAQFGNFMVDPVTGEILSLIDFERAAIFNEDEVLPCDYEEGAPFGLGLWVSPWEALMCPKSFRDDIHRIFMTLAVMMYGQEYVYYQAILATAAVRAYDSHGMEMEREYVVMILRNIWMAQRQSGEIFLLSSDRLDQTFAQFGIAHLDAPLITEFLPISSVRDKFQQLEKELIEMSIEQRPDYESIKQVLLDIVQLVE
jgi:serine/threonine protein kinase